MSQHTLHIQGEVHHPRAAVWDLLKNFPNIYTFDPNVKYSFNLDHSPIEGVGARRQCNLYRAGQWIREEVTEQIDGQKMVIIVYEGTMPIKNVVATISLTDHSRGTLVDFVMTFDNKIPLIGTMMANMMIKPMMTKSIKGFIAGMDHHLTTGEQVTNKTKLQFS